LALRIWREAILLQGSLQLQWGQIEKVLPPRLVQTSPNP
jgi:hypothetical protein